MVVDSGAMKNIRSISFPLVACLALGLTACSSYRVVKVTPSGGIVALQGDRDDAHAKAEKYMASRCPDGYKILEEGEVPVGSSTEGEAHKGTDLFGLKTVHESSSTHEETEWRVTYQCKSAAAAAPAAPAAPADNAAPAPGDDQGAAPAPADSAAPDPANGAQNEVHTLIIRM